MVEKSPENKVVHRRIACSAEEQGALALVQGYGAGGGDFF